ncbi:MAG: FHA domain-containing protein [Deltaproteobacteria bacterium]|nr:FHA domain-containing protein [Deltaproteobacteria bacterium]
MSTVRQWMKDQRLALRSGKSMQPGPAVFVEAAQNDEVVIAEQPKKRAKGQRWTTQKVAIDPAELDERNEERIQRMLALQPLVGDSSVVHLLKKVSDNPAPKIFVGRARRNDLVVSDTTVSSVHAHIENDGEVVQITDAGSSNGTFVNRRRLDPGEHVRLTTGDCVRLGGRVFYFLTGERLLLFLELRIVKQYGAGEARRDTNKGES